MSFHRINNYYIMRPITEEDLPEIRDIFNYYITHTTVSFYTHPLSLTEIRDLIFKINPKYKAYVICRTSENQKIKNDNSYPSNKSVMQKSKNKISGYAFFHPYDRREAYDICAEITIYLHPEETGRGLGRAVLSKLEADAKAVGIRSLLATICKENAASISLFSKNGYTLVGTLKEVGQKFDRLLDVVIYQKIIS